MENNEQKMEYVINFIKSLATIEYQIEPFVEQKKDLKKEYVENGWLSKDDIKAALKAYQLLKSDIDFESLHEAYEKISNLRNELEK
jgi:hypothetical protein